MLNLACRFGSVLVLVGTCALPALADGADGQKPAGPDRPVRPAFSDVDINKDGVISRAEFDAFRPQKRAEECDGPRLGKREHGRRFGDWRQHGPDLKCLDTNNDGKVNLEEFIAPMKAHFARMDTNKDGVLDEAELKAPPPPKGSADGDALPPSPSAK